VKDEVAGRNNLLKISDAENLLNEVMGRITVNGKKIAYSMLEIFWEKI
jgi:hypothetical protein